MYNLEIKKAVKEKYSMDTPLDDIILGRNDFDEMFGNENDNLMVGFDKSDNYYGEKGNDGKSE